MIRRTLPAFKRNVPFKGLEEFFHIASDAIYGGPVSAPSLSASEKAQEVMVTGRAWRCEELRKKSFEDLHKLWYVLYKERNRLLTERQACRRNNMVMPHPERSTKVRKSMAAIKTVVGERNIIFKQTQAKQNNEKAGV
uniref:Large ribosomal subunit protein uL29m n=1 Tax=Fibrocapsa japonica TaxID=94617 RepID=A0A7S2V0Y4_9STRA|mmetsp:Transcript_23909/g.34767  ORF Transcript_23909/g.34767 Transcript_23909/m.34767 type:complete len:138 (+) Transcript_23909:167-580(+)